MTREQKEQEILLAVSEVAKSHAPEVKQATKKIVDNVLVSGMMPKDALGLSDQQLENMYAQGYRLYNMGKFIEAKRVFIMLTAANVLEPKYIFGMAACCHMMGDFWEAAELYTRCGMFSKEDPVPFYHAADCYMQLKERIPAAVSLKMVMKRAGERPEFTVIKERAEIMLKTIEKEIEATKTSCVTPQEKKKEQS